MHIIGVTLAQNLDLPRTMDGEARHITNKLLNHEPKTLLPLR